MPITSQTVDMLLAFLLIIGGVIGAQIGARIGLAAEGRTVAHLVGAAGAGGAGKIALDLLLNPAELYSITPGLLP